MLLEEFLLPMGITQRELADAVNVPYQWINEIVNGKRGITPSTALRMAKFFRVSAHFWMNVQLRWNLYFAMQSEGETLKAIKHIFCCGRNALDVMRNCSFSPAAQKICLIKIKNGVYYKFSQIAHFLVAARKLIKPQPS